MAVDSLKKVCSSKGYLLFASGHAMSVGLTAYSMYHSVLPYFLRNLHKQNMAQPDSLHGYSEPAELNSSLTSLDQTKYNASDMAVIELIGRDIGVITGTGACAQLVMSIILGYILKRFSLRINWLIGSLCNLVAIILALLANDVTLMCVSNVFVSLGLLWLFTTVYAYHGEFAKSTKEFDFLVGWTNMFNSVGFVVGFSAVAAAYQFFGRRTTFLTIVGAIVLDAGSRLGLPPMKASESVGAQKEAETDQSDDLSVRMILVKWFHFFRQPLIILLTTQTIITYICGSILWATAPNYLASNLRAEQWQTGLIMGVGQGLGLRMAYSLFGFSVSVGMLVGYYGSGILVALVSFKYLYIGVGITLTILLLTYIPYIKLAAIPKTEEVVVSLNDVNLSSLALADMTPAMTRARLHVSSHSVARSGSHLSVNSLLKPPDPNTSGSNSLLKPLDVDA